MSFTTYTLDAYWMTLMWGVGGTMVRACLSALSTAFQNVKPLDGFDEGNHGIKTTVTVASMAIFKVDPFMAIFVAIKNRYF